MQRSQSLSLGDAPKRYRMTADRAGSLPEPTPTGAPAISGFSQGANWQSGGAQLARGSGIAMMRKNSGAPELWRTSSTTSVAEAVSDRLGCQSLRELCAPAGDGKSPGLFIPPDRLRLVRSLGEGAYAEVAIAEYLGPISEDSDTPAVERLVAVKTLKPHVIESGDDVVDFIDEVRVLLRLNHKNIVRFVGMGSLDSSSPESEWRTLYMVQEYMEGGTLKSKLLQQMVSFQKPLYSYADALRWCINIADALTCMHTSKPRVIHRDIKSENILLTTGDDGVTVAKLADFGLHALIQTASMGAVHAQFGYPSSGEQAAVAALAAASGRAGGKPPRTPKSPPHIPINPGKMHLAAADGGASPDVEKYNMTGRTGAFCYMAPEVLMGQPYNELVDVFSFGVVMYELFSRRLMAADMMNTTEWDESEGHAYKVAAGFRPPFARHIPQPLCELIDKCWAGVPELRPRMKEVAKALAAIQESGMVDEMDASSSAAAGGCCTVM